MLWTPCNGLAVVLACKYLIIIFLTDYVPLRSSFETFFANHILYVLTILGGLLTVIPGGLRFFGAIRTWQEFFLVHLHDLLIVVPLKGIHHN